MSEGNSWKTPAAVIGIITVILTAIGLYNSKKGSDLERIKQENQIRKDQTDQLDQDKKNDEIQSRIAELKRQLKVAQDQVQNFDGQIKQTYRQIQDYDSKQNDASASAADRAADHQSYLIVRENLQIFTNSKNQNQAQVDELQKEIDQLLK
jgi:hypothetical protein